jgi:hypothetical protein
VIVFNVLFPQGFAWKINPAEPAFCFVLLTMLPHVLSKSTFLLAKVTAQITLPFFRFSTDS